MIAGAGATSIFINFVSPNRPKDRDRAGARTGAESFFHARTSPT
jgi:hypothetical protein